MFENHVIIFSDKDCAFPDSGDLTKDWSRWFRRAVKKSADQVWGAERWIKAHPDRLFTDRACQRTFPIDLPGPDEAVFHRIVVAHDSADRCRKEFGGGADGEVRAGQGPWDAIRTIVVADAVMSLDNVVALVQAARVGGEVSFPLLAIGLATTVPLVVFGAALLTGLLNRFPLLVYLGAALLVYLAVEMFFEDVATRSYLEPFLSVEWVFGLTAATLFTLVAFLWTRKTGEAAGEGLGESSSQRAHDRGRPERRNAPSGRSRLH